MDNKEKLVEVRVCKKIVEQWIVGGVRHLVLLNDGTYMIGRTTNYYGYDKISQEEAEYYLNMLL